MPALTYTDVISNAIRDFDAIYNALKGKLVTPSSSTNVLTTAQMNNGTIATSAYASFITDQLFRVGIPSQDGSTMTGITPVTTNGVILSHINTTNILADGTYGTPTSTSIPVRFTIADPGYYDTTSIISGNVPIGNIALSDSNIATYLVTNNSVSSYLVRNLSAGEPSNVPMLSVSIPMGDVSATYGTPSTTETITNTLTIDGTSSTVAGASLTGSTGMYTISLKKNATYTATGTISPTVTTIPGFITGVSDVHIPTINLNITTNMAEATETVYIPAGSITGTLSNSATVSLAGSTGLSLYSDAPDTQYYTLTASATGLTVIGDTTAGYIEDSTNATIGTVADKTETYYIKAGIVPDTTVSLQSSQLTYNDTNGMVAVSGTTNYPLTYGVTMSSPVETSITEGYINDTKYDVTVNGSRTIYIKEGAITETASINVQNATGDTGIITTGSGDYSITVPIVASVSTTSKTDGYISNNNQITNVGDTASATFSVAHGDVEITPRLTITAVDANDGKTATVLNETIFDTTIPASGDYYTIVADATKSVTPGYTIASDVDIDTGITRYLKKATFAYVTMGDSEESFLQVTSGGYVPSGLIADIAPISGTIDTAVVGVGFDDNSSGIITGTQPASGTSYYTVTAGKSTVNAGYISTSDGTVSGTTYILHGSESLATAFNQSTIDTSTTPILNQAGTAYTLAVEHSVTNTLTFTEGYMKASDITLNGDSNTLTKTITSSGAGLSIVRGAYGVTSQSFTLTADTAVALGTDSTNGFSFTPKLTGSLTIDATTDGYIHGTAERQSISIANTDSSIHATTYFIKKGTGPVARSGLSDINDWTTNKNSASVPISANITDNSATVLGSSQTAGYTISVGGYADATLKLDTGYYSTNEIDITGGKVYVNKTISISHGHATVSLNSPTNTVTMAYGQTDLSSHLTTGTVPATGYITINSSVNVDGSLTITPGYIKDEAADKTFNSITGASTAVHIATTNLSETTQTTAATNRTGTTVPANTTVYGAITIGSNDGDITAASSYATASTSETGLRDAVILPTANTYALYDTKVVLTPDAMGSNVVADLNRLQARLDGNLQTA